MASMLWSFWAFEVLPGVDFSQGMYKSERVPDHRVHLNQYIPSQKAYLKIIVQQIIVQ